MWDLESCISCYGNALLPRAFQNSSTVKNIDLPYFSNGKHRRATKCTHTIAKCIKHTHHESAGSPNQTRDKVLALVKAAKDLAECG